MLEFEQNIKFEENLEKEASYTPYYQITRLASDAYQIYSHETKLAEIQNSKNTLKTIASLRGGSYLNAELSKAVTELAPFSSIIVTENAVSLNKTAAASTGKEPWQLVSVNGVEYFIKAEGEGTEEQKKEASEDSALTKTASAKPQTYTISIEAHNVAEIAKIAEHAVEEIGADPASFGCPMQKKIVFDIQSANPMHQVHQDVHNFLGKHNIYVPDGNVKEVDQAGAMCCNCPACQRPVCDNDQKVQAPTAVQGPKGEVMYTLTSPETQHVAHAKLADTLKTYADAHYSNYTITDNRGHVIHHVASELTSFSEELSDFLLKSYAAEHNKIEKKAENYTNKALNEMSEIEETEKNIDSFESLKDGKTHPDQEFEVSDDEEIRDQETPDEESTYFITLNGRPAKVVSVITVGPNKETRNTEYDRINDEYNENFPNGSGWGADEAYDNFIQTNSQKVSKCVDLAKGSVFYVSWYNDYYSKVFHDPLVEQYVSFDELREKFPTIVDNMWENKEFQGVHSSNTQSADVEKVEAAEHNKIEKKAVIIGPDGKTKDMGAPPEVGDTVVEEDGTATEVKVKAAAGEAPAQVPPMPAKEQPKDQVQRDPAEKDPQDTSATGDDDVKRWKGMREDPSSGKYIVYITETEEHIFENPNDAIDYLVRK